MSLRTRLHVCAVFHVTSDYVLAPNVTALCRITPYLSLLQLITLLYCALIFCCNISLHYILFLGSHTLTAEYACQTIPGSPLVSDIYDANKVRIEGARGGEVNVPMVIDGRNWCSCLSVNLSVIYYLLLSIYFSLLLSICCCLLLLLLLLLNCHL